MKTYRIWLMLLCLVLAASICACSGEVLQQGSQGASGQLGTGELGTNAESGGNAGSLIPGNAFENAEHMLTLRVLETGKSDCMLIRLDDTVIMIDTADADDYGEISDTLESLGIARIDYLILTHFDNDHIGSAAKIIEDFEVAEVYMPNYVRDSGLYRSLMNALSENAARTKVTKLNDDTTVSLPTGSLWINVSRVYPELSHEDPIPEDSMDNDLSLICGLSLGDFSALFMGDAEKARCEDFLAQTQYAGQYDFVKLPHHGSHNKALRDILTSCGVKYGVICTDAFANIELEVVNLLRNLGALTYYSYNGNMVLRTDGKTVECTQ
ncbi:MAG: MBL fold metallo-hydrolase [Clostridia bacterium]|nr:MBL fold metallo-hydrolase [Clostridia bacterium]